MSKCTALIKFFSFCVIFEPLLWLSALSLFSWFPWASKNHPLPPPPLPPSPLLSRLVLLRTCDMTLHKFHFLGNKKPFPTLFFAANQPKEIFSFFEVKDDFRLFKRSDDGQKTKAAPKPKLIPLNFSPPFYLPHRHQQKRRQSGKRGRSGGFFFAPQGKKEKKCERSKKHGFSFRAKWMRTKEDVWVGAGLSSLLLSLRSAFFSPHLPLPSPLSSS